MVGDTLLDSLLGHYQRLVGELKKLREHQAPTLALEDFGQDETPPEEATEDRLYTAMVKAIRTTQSHHRTFAGNG